MCRSPSPWLHRGSADLTTNALKKAKKSTKFNNFGSGEYRRVSQCAAHQSPGPTEEAANLHGCLKTQMVRKCNCQAGNRRTVPTNLPTTTTLPSTPTLAVATSRYVAIHTRYMHDTPKCAYVSLIRLHPVERLIGCYAVVRPRQRPVAQVHEDCPHLRPEAWWAIQVAQHRAHAVRGHTEDVLRRLRSMEVSPYPFVFTILSHSPSHELLHIIKHYNLDRAPLSFSILAAHISNSAGTSGFTLNGSTQLALE